MSAYLKKSISIAIMLVTIVSTFFMVQAKTEIKETEPLVIALIQSSGDKEYVKPVQYWFLKIYTEALSRMDIPLEYRILPAKRASLYTDQGVLDGELSRVFDYK